MNTLPARQDGRDGVVVPALVADAGEATARRFLEYFAAQLRNRNTRAAYYRAVTRFLAWCAHHGITTLGAIEPLVVAAYVEQLGRQHDTATVKQHLAAIRCLFDWLAAGGVLASNPAAPVRGPKHVVRQGKTPVLTAAEARQLLGAIDVTRPVGLRDRALIGVLTYSFARVGAAVAMTVSDYYPRGKRWWLRLHEKGGRYHEMPAHHTLEAYMDAYLAGAGIAGGDAKAPLFRTARGRSGTLTERPMHRTDVWRMVRRRARDAGILTPIGCHTFRATGITAYLSNDGTLEHAQAMAAHASPRTTKLYDRTNDAITLDEVERIVI